MHALFWDLSGSMSQYQQHICIFWERIPCRPLTFLAIPGNLLFGGLPNIEISFQFQMQAKVHLQLVVFQLSPQLVSTVCTKTKLHSMCYMRSIMRMLASSIVHGASKCKFGWDGTQSTRFPSVSISCCFFFINSIMSCFFLWGNYLILAHIKSLASFSVQNW